ncbi:hypothetical protein HYPDE_26718 [Hyphomicrobium denitrificans 1NES1]|uniref:Uncharacterized protein n=1 Tax=Hyphomicrobium denitrificans 1NES1 TaxID=670307 RepID=N0B0R5_9HYPH|nr:hypothetical protein [Hyphomicrobium denitrificans]AGK57024.1 hypothetical protein HYPDE_26718 [Hyphomicrobium denitrificans 1NES1]
MSDADDTYTACAMQGLVTEWDGRTGIILTDDGERITIHEIKLRLDGFKNIPTVGDRVHFWAEEEVRVTYKLKEVRMIEARARDDAVIAKLEKRYRDRTLKQRIRYDGYAVETQTGTIESFDAKRCSGSIHLEDGGFADIAPDSVRKRDVKRIKPGTMVRFRAVYGGKNCLAADIVPLTPP